MVSHKRHFLEGILLYSCTFTNIDERGEL